MKRTRIGARRPEGAEHGRARAARAWLGASALLCALCAAGSAAPASADETDVAAGPRKDFARPGIYLAFAGGGLIETFDLPDPLLDGLKQSGYVGGKIGSRHNRWIATETSVDYAVTGFEQDGAAWGAPGLTVEVNPLYLSGNVKLFPLEGRFQPYVAGGIGGAWAFVEAKAGGGSASETFGSFLGRVGGGLDVYVTENVVLGPELYWNITTGDLERFRTLSIGGVLMYRF